LPRGLTRSSSALRLAAEKIGTLESAVSRAVLQVCRPALRFIVRPMARRYPRATAYAVAPLTRMLARTSSTFGCRVARYVTRRAPRDTNGVKSRYLGLSLTLDLRDNVQRDLFYLGRYEARLVDFVLGELAPRDVFIDVGAHIGTYALPAARRLSHAGHVFAFEPDERTADALSRHAERNGLSAITVVRVGLSSQAGVTDLRAPGSGAYDPDDASVRSVHGTGEVVDEITILRLDDWVVRNSLDRVDIIKVDVEGAEYDVVKGMSSVLRSYEPRLLIVEVVPGHLARAGVTPEMLSVLLAEHGYSPFGPSVAEVASRQTGPFWPNAVLRRVD
jgi:FkbM family methyltransferase